MIEQEILTPEEFIEQGKMIYIQYDVFPTLPEAIKRQEGNEMICIPIKEKAWALVLGLDKVNRLLLIEFFCSEGRVKKQLKY